MIKKLFIFIVLYLFSATPVSAVDGTTIQTQIDMLPATGGTVTLPAGEYILSSPHGSVNNFPDGSPIQTAILINKDNVILQGQGSSTILQLAPHTKMRAISITSSNVTVKNLVVDGNKTNRNGGVPWPGGDVVDALVYANQTSANIVFENLEVRNGIEDAIGSWQGQNIIFRNNYNHDNGTSNAGGAGISLSGVIGGQAINNRLENNSATGIWSAFDASDIKILDNTITNNAGGGITIGGSSVSNGLGPNNTGFEITNNTLSDNGSGGFASITIFASNNGIVENNHILSSAYDNIQISGTNEIYSDNWHFIGNICTGPIGIHNLGNSRNIVLISNSCQSNLPQQTPTPFASLADYWQGKAVWKQAFTLPEGNPGWITGFGASAQVVVVGQKWYLFTRHVDWNYSGACPSKMTLAVSKSTDSGQTWTTPVDILTNTPGSSQECAATDGGAYYQTSTNTWHILYQCLGINSGWNGCHATRVGPDPVGPFTPDPQNPVIHSGSLWSKICDSPTDKCRTESLGPLGKIVDEGTFDIFDFDGQYFWISFHGFDGKYGFRGIAKTADFHTWIAGDEAQGIPKDAILNPSDAVPWTIPWYGGPIGFGPSRMMKENGYWYQFAEAADINLGSVGTDPNQTWADGIFRSDSLLSTSWSQPTAFHNPVNSTNVTLKTTDLAAANPSYVGFFRDQSGKIYMHYSRVGYFPYNSGIFFFTLETNSPVSPSPTPIPGDVNGDGHVDMYDFTKMRSNFGNPYTIYNYNDLVGNFRT